VCYGIRNISGAEGASDDSKKHAVEPAVIPTFTESPLVIVSVCGVESENAPVCPEPIENVLLPLAPLCLSLTVDVPVAAVLTRHHNNVILPDGQIVCLTTT